MEFEVSLMTDRQTSVDKNKPEVEDELLELSNYPVWWVFTSYFDPLELASIDLEGTTEEDKEQGEFYE